MTKRKDGNTCSSVAKSTGDRCGNPPILGGNVCRIHGGKAPQVLAASARNILESLVGPALVKMREILDDDETPPSVRLSTVKDILDRTGFKPVETLEVVTIGWVEQQIALLEAELVE